MLKHLTHNLVYVVTPSESYIVTPELGFILWKWSLGFLSQKIKLNEYSISTYSLQTQLSIRQTSIHLCIVNTWASAFKIGYHCMIKCDAAKLIKKECKQVEFLLVKLVFCDSKTTLFFQKSVCKARHVCNAVCVCKNVCENNVHMHIGGW